MKFTLDQNCLIALERNEPTAAAIRALAEAHDKKRIQVAVLGISASERQLGGGYLDNIGAFRAYLLELGLQGLDIYKPVGIWGVTFYDWSHCASAEDEPQMRAIHEVMFRSEYDWADVAARTGEHVESTDGDGYRLWRNRRCDVQGLHSHIRNGADVFVTSDWHFHGKAAPLIGLGAKRIATPDEAAALV
ncbi:hypothetical protein VQ042_08100 [Aurantimonas sp. A2-1-M11]|uniref:hypothetical protein n=1 Tax=Aurantimonas sp. A2-1-M11 TaxID=3113712 RepID=UPI002F95A5C7